MFEALGRYRKIIVSGPQRSGTTICAKMIAKDLGYIFVDESAIGFTDVRSVFSLLDCVDGVVIQCPALSSCLWLFSRPDTLIVFMHRDVGEIRASQDRPIFAWSPDRTWTTAREKRELMKYGVNEGAIAEVKYAAWAVQKEYVSNHVDIEYAWLAEHPLWLPKDQRAEFGPKQTD